MRILLARKIKACAAEGRWMRNPLWPSYCVTPAGTSTNIIGVSGLIQRTLQHNRIYFESVRNYLSRAYNGRIVFVKPFLPTRRKSSV